MTGILYVSLSRVFIFIYFPLGFIQLYNVYTSRADNKKASDHMLGFVSADKYVRCDTFLILLSTYLDMYNIYLLPIFIGHFDAFVFLLS